MQRSINNRFVTLNEQSKFVLAEREFESGWLVVAPEMIGWQRQRMFLLGPDQTKLFNVADTKSIHEVTIERSAYLRRWIRIALKDGDAWTITCGIPNWGRSSRLLWQPEFPFAGRRRFIRTACGVALLIMGSTCSPWSSCLSECCCSH